MPKTVIPLTATQVRNAKPADKLYKLQDGGGLSLWIYPTGNRTWHLRLTNANGLREEVNQPLESMTLAEAREWREENRKKVRDAGTMIEQPKQSALFKDVFEAWYETWKPEVSDKYGKQVYNAVLTNVMPTLGKMDVTEIKPVHIVNSLRGMEDRGVLEYLRRTKVGITLALDFAMARGLVDMNAARSVTPKAFKKHHSKHFRALEPKQLPELIAAIEHARASKKIEERTYYLIYWQLLTMTRASEAARALWEEIDDKAKLWVLGSARMKKRREFAIPLPDFAMEIVRYMASINTRGVYLFEGKETKPMNSQTVYRALARMGIDSTAHGLRALARTYLEETGKFRYEPLEVCLSHKVGGTTERAYNRSDYLGERREIMNYWASVIQELKEK